MLSLIRARYADALMRAARDMPALARLFARVDASAAADDIFDAAALPLRRC